MQTALAFDPIPLVIGPPIAVAWLILGRRLFHDPLSPLVLLLVSWVLPLLMQGLNLSYYETPWSVRSTLVVGWAVFSMTAVSVAAAAFVSRRDDERAAPEFARTLDLLREPRVLALLLAGCAVTYVVYLYVEFLTNPAGIPLVSILTGRPLIGGAAHRWGKDSPLQAVVALLFVLAPMSYLAWRANTGRRGRSLLLFAALLYPVLGALKLSRSDVFIGVVTIAVAAYYARRWNPARRRVRWALLAGTALAAVTAMYFMVRIRVGGVAVEDLYAEFIGFRLGPDVPFSGVLAAIYGYLALPFENLNRFVSFHDPWALNPGVNALRPLLSAAGLGNLADQMNAGILYPPPVSPAAGSATFLTGVYADLGALGAALAPVLYALIVNVVYVRFRRRPTLAHTLLYANFAYPWLWLFFNNGFSVLSIYINAAFVIGFGLLAPELRRRPAAVLAGSVA